MSISTKAGDKGQTSLWSGERVWKDDLRVAAYGTLDELDAHIGDARHVIVLAEVKTLLLRIQHDLYHVMGELATVSGSYPKPLSLADSEDLTDIVHHYESILQLSGFVIPGNTPSSAKLDICRTVLRRAERHIIALHRTEPVSEHILQYVNRLSDVFFILARLEEKQAGKLLYQSE